jgi:protein-S-isoprenylcysteine O-methyltransferase Ste14
MGHMLYFCIQGLHLAPVQEYRRDIHVRHNKNGSMLMPSHSIVEKTRSPITRIFAVILLIIIIFSSSAWERISFVSNLFFLIGCILVGIASLGRLWCSLYIGGYKNTTLVTSGPYSISRNPLYFFSMIGAAGVGLATETLLIPCVIVILFSVYYPSVIRSEERRLLSLHGERFEAYRRNTPTFFPKLSLLQEPETYTVNPRLLKRDMFRALMFIWLMGILEIIEAFHETGVLPIYLRIY